MDVTTQVIVGLGTNLGSRRAHLRAAVDLLDALPGVELGVVASVYESAPLGPPQPDYLNTAARLSVALGKGELLSRLQSIEGLLGRERGERWGPRPIDLDILWSDDGPTSEPGLTVPHPGLEERAFALAPLLDVAPELEPRYGARARELGRPRLDGPMVRSVPWSKPHDVRGRLVEVFALDRLDAVAAAVTALCARLSPEPPRPSCVRTADLDEQDPLRSYLSWVVTLIEEGFAVRHALWTGLGRARVVGEPWHDRAPPDGEIVSSLRPVAGGWEARCGWRS